MRIALIGPGSLGCLLSSFLLEGGGDTHSIALLDYNKERAEKINNNGIFFIKGEEEKVYSIDVYTDPGELGLFDILFLCVKSYDIDETIRMARPLLGKNTLLIFMQNGISHLQYRGDSDWTPVFGTTTEGATSIGPGRIRHGGSGKTYFGFLDDHHSLPTEKLLKVISLLQKGGMDVEISPEIYTKIWEKLFINVGINGLTALHNCKNGELLENQAIVTQMKVIITEAEAVAEKEGIFIENPFEKAVAVCKSTANNVSSMLQDVRLGKQTEINAINGAITKLGKKHGIPTPANSNLVASVKKITRK